MCEVHCSSHHSPCAWFREDTGPFYKTRHAENFWDSHHGSNLIINRRTGKTSQRRRERSFRVQKRRRGIKEKSKSGLFPLHPHVVVMLCTCSKHTSDTALFLLSCLLSPDRLSLLFKVIFLSHFYKFFPLGRTYLSIFHHIFQIPELVCLTLLLSLLPSYYFVVVRGNMVDRYKFNFATLLWPLG